MQEAGVYGWEATPTWHLELQRPADARELLNAKLDEVVGEGREAHRRQFNYLLDPRDSSYPQWVVLLLRKNGSIGKLATVYDKQNRIIETLEGKTVLAHPLIECGFYDKFHGKGHRRNSARALVELVKGDDFKAKTGYDTSVFTGLQPLSPEDLKELNLTALSTIYNINRTAWLTAYGLHLKVQNGRVGLSSGGKLVIATNPVAKIGTGNTSDLIIAMLKAEGAKGKTIPPYRTSP